MSERPLERSDHLDYEVVVVSYRSRPLVERILEELDPAVPLAVVDNAHGADGLEEIVRRRAGARYLDGPGTGYGAGANLGARTSSRPVVVFLNPDALPTVAVLEALAAALAADPELVVVSAVQVDRSGRAELGVAGWEPSVPRAAAHSVGLHKLLPDVGLWARPRPYRPIAVDWVGGACTAVRVDHFRALGGYDESYFVYNEDVELGRAVRAAGLRLAVRTDLLVTVLAEGSGDARSRMLRRRGDSMMRYLRRHHPRRRVEGVRAALAGGIAARLVVCRVRGRHRQADEHAAYLRGLFTGPPP